jgi:hypothetical protein
MPPVAASYRRKTDAFPVDGIKRLHLRAYFNPEYASSISLAVEFQTFNPVKDLICKVT